MGKINILERKTMNSWYRNHLNIFESSRVMIDTKFKMARTWSVIITFECIWVFICLRVLTTVVVRFLIHDSLEFVVVVSVSVSMFQCYVMIDFFMFWMLQILKIFFVYYFCFVINFCTSFERGSWTFSFSDL